MDFLKDKKYRNIIYINVISLFFAIVAYYYFDKIEILTAIIATGISISIGISKLQIENDKIFKELFMEFNNKYDKKYNDKLNIICKKGKVEEDEISLIIDYLNFSAEEYLWYKKNRIDKIVWESWKNGIIYYLNNDAINKIIIKEKEQENSYYGLFDEIGDKINNWR